MASKKRVQNLAPPGAVVPPSGADRFSILLVEVTRKRSEQTDKMYTSTKSKRMHGAPLEDGTKPESWPVAQFSTRFVLEQWGPGTYRVDWHAKDGSRISGQRLSLDTPPSETKARAARVHRAPAAVEHDEPSASSSDGMPQSPFQWLMWMTQREEAAAERRRQEAREEDQRRREEYERNAERDRNFMATMIQVMGAKSSAPDVNGDLLRREMALSVREGLQRIDESVAQRLSGIAAAAAASGDGPTDLGDGAERIGLAFLEELEGVAPSIIEAAIPRVISVLEGHGWKPSPELLTRIRAMREAAAANGGN